MHELTKTENIFKKTEKGKNWNFPFKPLTLICEIIKKLSLIKVLFIGSFHSNAIKVEVTNC